MANEQVTLDSTLIDATNTQIVLDDTANGIELISHDYPDPGPSYMGASSVDTEGSVPVQNQLQDRTITVVARCFGATNMRARVKALQQKAGKFNREGGTLTRTLTDGTVIHFTVKSAKVSVPADWHFAHNTSAMVTLEVLCDPVGYGAEVTVTGQTETTLPCNVYVVSGIKGDQPALGRLVVTDAQGADQWHVEYGMESRYYPGSTAGTSTAHLFYEAETRLTYGGAAGTAVSGASGGTIVAGTVGSSYGALVSTASSGTVHATHIGTFRVKARVYCPANAGTVTYALQWGTGDLHAFTVNDPVTYPPTSAATFRHIDLGLVYLPKAATGAQRWEGRILAKSTTANDRAGIDCLYLYPAAEGYGEASGVAQADQPTVYTCRDEFDQSSGNLNAKTLPVGGTWATSGAATDFVTSGSGALTRAGTSDSGPRFAIAGSTSFTNCAVQVDVLTNGVSANEPSEGVIARWTDSSNYLTAYITTVSGPRAQSKVVVNKIVGGVTTTLYTSASSTDYRPIFAIKTVALVVTAGGTWSVYAYTKGGTKTLLSSGYDSSLATGGALASGKAGIRDANTSPTAITRTYDNFLAWVPPTDAAMFASQSLEVRHNRAIREDSTGTYYQQVSSFEGDYLRIPPAGAEARSARFIVKAVQLDPDSAADTAIDDLTVQLYYTPRWSTVPET